MALGFCTIFDSNYLSRGLALYDSLDRSGDAFVLWVLAMDDRCAGRLRDLGLPRLRVVSLHEFETPELRATRAVRTRQEYTWTCTPHFIRYCLRHETAAESLTYVDPDVWFFAPPSLVIGELAPDESILLTEHKFAPRHAHQMQTAGPYAVQFNVFRRTADGMAALDWWCDRCLEWCFNRHERDLFGDQRYLDDWPTRFRGVRVAAHPGAAIGPWNVEAYAFRQNGGRVEVQPHGSEGWVPLVFVHFHSVRFFTNGRVMLAAGYRLSGTTVEMVYAPYIHALLTVAQRVPASANPHGAVARGVLSVLRDVRYLLRGSHTYAARCFEHVDGS